MSSIEFEITIQRKFGPSWPVVVRVKQPDGLTTHTEGKLELSEDDFIKLTQEQENYLEYGILGKYNLTEFNVEQAVNSVREALGEIPGDVLANLDGAIAEPTLEQLLAQLTNAKKPYTLLHFICHGRLDKDGETALFWATKDNRVQLVKGRQLMEELKYIGIL